MSTLEEHLTSGSVTALYDAYLEGLIQTERKNGNGRYGFNHENFPVAGPAIIRYVVTKLWETVERDPNPPNAMFPYHAKRSIRSILAEDLGKSEKYTNLSSDIARLIRANHIGHVGVGKAGVWLRSGWVDIDLIYEPSNRLKIDHKVEKRIEEESEKAESTLTATTDLRKVALPEGNAEAVLDFVKRFVPAALRVQAERDSLRDQLREAKAQLEEIEEAKAGEVWVGTADTIKDLMNGEPQVEAESSA